MEYNWEEKLDDLQQDLPRGSGLVAAMRAAAGSALHHAQTCEFQWMKRDIEDVTAVSNALIQIDESEAYAPHLPAFHARFGAAIARELTGNCACSFRPPYDAKNMGVE